MCYLCIQIHRTNGYEPKNNKTYMTMKKQLLLLVVMLLPMVAMTGAVKIDGIYYELGTKLKVAKVTKNQSLFESYGGDIVLPSTIIYDDVEYTVSSIGEQAFSSCTGLTSITIPSSVTSIGVYAFFGCEGLTSINIPNSVTSIESGAFDSCTGLTSITIPSSVTSIGGNVFSNCTSLTSITIPNSVTSIGNGFFQHCTSMTSINIPSSVTSIGNAAFNGCTSLTSITIPSGVTRLESNVFRDCTGLTSITIPNSVTSIGKRAFYRCTGLTSITIPNSVTSIEGYAFQNCGGLTSIVVESGNLTYDSRDNSNAIIETASNTLILGCKNTIFPQNVTSIEKFAFSGCTGLTSITIPNSVTSIGEFAFSGCTGLTSITIPNSVTSIGESVFYYCSGLTSIVVESGNLIYDSRDNSNAIIETASNTLILGCKNTIFPSNVTSIGDYAFSGCTGLSSIAIPNSVTSIGWEAFRDCTGLKEVIIGTGISNIEDYSFAGCVGILNFYCYSKSVPTTGTNAFKNSEQEYIILHVPSASIGTYKATYPWSSFGSIVALTDSDPKPTGIEKVYGSRDKINGFFDLNGRRLNGEPTQKGVYIHNGKKVVKK